MKRRREIIEAKAKLNTIKQAKKAMKHLNAGLALMAAGAVLNQVSVTNPVVVQAQSTNRLTASDFLGLISDYAQKIASENDLYASVMIAQAALESGWGNSTLSQAPNYNLFGIKGEYNGNTVVKDTLEDDGTGNYYEIQDGFRKYDNYGQSLTDYASLLTGDNDANNWRYNFYYGARVSSTSSYTDATLYLTGRYATDTRYAEKLNRIIAENNLTRYDVTSNGNVAETPSTPVEEQPVQDSKSVYTVQAGDGYWAIARKYGTTVEALKALNGATSNLIHPGQVLKLPTIAVIEQPNNNNESVTNHDDQTNNNSGSSTASTYTIQRGDGLYGIARKFGLTLDQLKSLNGLSSDLIHPGQVLKVTAPSQSTTPTNGHTGTNNGSTTNPTTSGSTYSVNTGEGLYRIAVNHGMTLEQLKALNGLTSNLIHPGQVLKVSSTTTQATSQATVATATAKTAGQQTIEVAATNNTAETVETTTTQEVVEQIEQVEVPAQTTNAAYTVKAGDTLYSIAQRNGLDVYKLIEQNNGSANILVGQSIDLN